MNKLCHIIFCLCVFSLSYSKVCTANDNVVNLYIWASEVPSTVIQQFESETGIKVNYATYDNNETLYAKLRANPNSGYDIIEPSGYYVERMRKEDMLEKIDRSQLPNLKNLDPFFQSPSYDPHSEYSIPYLWGVTGIFVNDQFYAPDAITSWQELWDQKFADQLLLINDLREVFSIGLITLGYSPNDSDPQHIKAAFDKLRALYPNVKLFASDAIPSIIVDADVTIGMVWNGDLARARHENPHLHFIYPKDGFVIWVDNMAIPKNAPHRKNAYRFLNFLLRAESGKQATLLTNFSTTNLAGRNLLPESMRNDKTIFPAPDILKRGHFQEDVTTTALSLYGKYWDLLKLGS